ncbi:MAG: hypothetical protein RLY31_90 [Bacteroidota bacterium]|jgi:hypothetical protein
MNKSTLLQLALIWTLGFIVLQFLPFWGIVPICLLAGGLVGQQTERQLFLTGFAGGFLLWAGSALVMDYQNDHILSVRMAALFSMPKAAMILLTGFIGGWLGGLGVWSGGLARRVFS